MTTPEGENREKAVQKAVRKAVEDALASFGEYPTRWVLCAEALGADGERSLWLTTGEATKTWDVLGMLGFLDALERAKVAHLADDD